MERKFNVYDKVWVMIDNRVCERGVRRIKEKKTISSGWEQSYRSYEIIGSDDKFPEHRVFPTKQALLESL